MKLKNYQRLPSLTCKFDMYCDATLDDTCINLFRKEVNSIRNKCKSTEPNVSYSNVTDEHIKRMQQINKTCKAIIEQVEYNYNN